MKPEQLPKTAQELFAMIGSEELKALTRSAGGQSLSISSQGEKPAFLTISDAAWQIIRDRWHGSKVYFPKCLRVEEADRNQTIRQQRAAGITVNALARQHGLSDRQIMAICSGLVDDKQTDLFEPTEPQTDLFGNG